MAKLTVNNVVREHDAEGDTPLLWVLREQLGLTGTKYGCGLAQCGSCTVHIDGVPTRSCVRPVSTVAANEKIGTRCRKPGRPWMCPNAVFAKAA
jgi:isoquinoline 1-oxidoreductase alpha subunit